MPVVIRPLSISSRAASSGTGTSGSSSATETQSSPCSRDSSPRRLQGWSTATATTTPARPTYPTRRGVRWWNSLAPAPAEGDQGGGAEEADQGAGDRTVHGHRGERGAELGDLALGLAADHRVALDQCLVAAEVGLPEPDVGAERIAGGVAQVRQVRAEVERGVPVERGGDDRVVAGDVGRLGAVGEGEQAHRDRENRPGQAEDQEPSESLPHPQQDRCCKFVQPGRLMRGGLTGFLTICPGMASSSAKTGLNGWLHRRFGCVSMWRRIKPLCPRRDRVSGARHSSLP